jgi:hypothetical protein
MCWNSRCGLLNGMAMIPVEFRRDGRGWRRKGQVS